MLTGMLAESGADVSFVRTLTGVPSGHAIIQVNRDGQNCIMLYGGANQAITRTQVDEVLAQFTAGDLLVLQNEVNELPYLMQRACERGLHIALNPSPINDAIAELPLSAVRWLILNEVEAAQILGEPVTDGAAAARALHEKLPQAAIVLTMGEDGSYYDDGTQQVSQPVFSVCAVDTTAAGDLYAAGFICGLARGASLEKCGAAGARISSEVVKVFGSVLGKEAWDKVFEEIKGF